MSETRSQNQYEKLRTIPQAARELRLREEYVRELCIKRGIAIRFPGQKMLRVPIDELRETLLASKVPGKVDPRVKC